MLMCVALLALQMISCSSSGDNLKLIPVKTGEKWGFVDRTGKYVINPQFKNVEPFKNGMAAVQTMDYKFGYINEKGSFVINPQFYDADSFNDGLALVTSENDKIGYINKKGNYIIGPFDCEDAIPFSDGLAFVSPYDSGPVCYDKNGSKIFELQDVSMVYSYKEGLARIVGVDGKYGFIDKKGVVVINNQFDNVEDFSEGLAAFEQSGKWGYIDKSGKIVINPQYKMAFQFNDGVAAVISGGQCGIIDKKGNYVINPQFDNVVVFRDGMAAFLSGESYGFIDKKGKIIINPQFDLADNFRYGLAIVATSNEKFGFIDKNGKYAITPQFDFATNFYDNIAFVKSNGKYGIINKEGKYVVNPQFDMLGIDIYESFDSYEFREWYDNNKNYITNSYASNIKAANSILSTLFASDDPCGYHMTVDDFGNYDNEVLNKYEIRAEDEAGIKINGYFKKPIYREVKSYEYDRWGDRYETKKREYHRDEPCGVIKLSISGDKLGKEVKIKTLAPLMVSLLENKYGIKMEKDDDRMVWFDANNQKGLGVGSSSSFLFLYFIQDKSVYDKEHDAFGF